MSYSVDLRERVLRVRTEEDLTIEETAKRFLVSERSINRWLKLKELKAGKPGPKQSRTIDAEQLKQVVTDKLDA